MLTNNASAQVGNLDSSFSNDGIAAFYPDGYGSSVAIQTDGKIIVGGYDGNEGFTLLRLKENGSLDSSFGINGKANAIVGLDDDQDEVITMQPDGKIVVTGTCTNFDGHPACALVRFNANGDLDNGFSDDGKVVFTFTDPTIYHNYGGRVTIQSDQKIIALGSTSTIPTNNVFATARFNPDGSLDNTYGNNGIVLTPVGNAFAAGSAVTVQQDGKICVGGGSSSTDNRSSFALVRYNSDGSLDNSFGNSGKVTTYFGNGQPGDNDFANGMIIRSNGKILLAGLSYLSPDTFTTIGVAQYNSNGSLDNNFGNSGKVRIRMLHPKFPEVYAIAEEQDKKVIIAGGSYNGGSTAAVMFLIRINENGSMDSTFGENGFVFTVVDTSDGQPNTLLSIAMDNLQRIVAAGGSYLGMTVLRYLSGLNVGILNLSTNDLPIIIYPNPVQSEATLKYKLTNEENLSICLYNTIGLIVQTFITNETRNQGDQKEVLYLNKTLPAGEYILSISNGVHSQSIKITKM